MNRKIGKVAVLGSGVMGSAIACHFANIGCEVLLLDMVPKEPTEEERKKGLDLSTPAVRNRIVTESLNRSIKSSPAPLFSRNFLSRITTGNFEDDLPQLATCDWVLEVVVENLEIKRALYQKVAKNRKLGTLVTSNTSGIPIHMMAENMDADFKAHFCGVHFFNPPRYLELLEIIPHTETAQEVVNFLMEYGSLYLGKSTVQCKDTPAFIGNRVGVWSLLKVVSSMKKHGLSIDEVDKLTGPVIGRPKSATFRTSDVVGLDVFTKVAQNLYAALPNDESRNLFVVPEEIKTLEGKGWLGDKTGSGFYKKSKNAEGKTEILTIDLKTLEYKPQAKVKLAALEGAKMIDSLRDRFKFLMNSTTPEGDFYRDIFLDLFRYVSFRIPEISDHIFSIDTALRAGFGWEMGPFEIWDALGVKDTIAKMEQAGLKPAPWVYDMLTAGCQSFYSVKDAQSCCYSPDKQKYELIPGSTGFIILENRSEGVVWKNAESKIIDLGDGIINFSWHSKGHTLGDAVMTGLGEAIALAEREYRGLVIGHDGSDFSFGANLALIFMNATEQEYDEIERMVRQFQDTVMRVRYSSIPVVVAASGRTLGGGCEIVLHADRVQAAAETYVGLVEVGVGLLPSGGGLKEFAKRLSDAYRDGDIELNRLQSTFMNIATAKVATSAVEALEMGILRPEDHLSINTHRRIAQAKALAIHLAELGYTRPIKDNHIRVQGKTGKALFLAGIHGMKTGGYISEHDAKIAEKIAHVMCGGNLSQPQTVSERYLLDLEREAFISLCGEPKTLERIQSVLKGGKPLRN